MPADAAGRFCQSCQKSVIDFSSKSDEEIKLFLSDKQGEKLCGRFFAHQVARIRIEIDQNILISGIPFWQKFLVVLLVCLGPDFLGVDFVFAQADSVHVMTGQIDSLVSIPETDSSLSVPIDSVQKPFKFKKQITSKIAWVFEELPVMGNFITVIDKKDPVATPWKTPIILHEPEDDTLIAQTETGMTSKKNPEVPERPQKKPSLPESAIITDTGDRRKTRRG